MYIYNTHVEHVNFRKPENLLACLKMDFPVPMAKINSHYRFRNIVALIPPSCRNKKGRMLHGKLFLGKTANQSNHFRRRKYTVHDICNFSARYHPPRVPSPNRSSAALICFCGLGCVSKIGTVPGASQLTAIAVFPNRTCCSTC